MPTTPDELTVSYKDGDQEVVKELDKQILSKGAWTTIIYHYQDWNNTKQEFGPDKFTIRRYQKRNGEYAPRSKFNITNAKQAKMIIETLQGWTKE